MTSWQPKLICGGSLLLVVAAGLTRLSFLGADPNYEHWVGYIADEGRWIHHARMLHLFPGQTLPSVDVHTLIAPLFQLASYANFELFGLSYATARLIPAVSGTVLVALFWWRIRTLATPEMLVLSVAILALQPDLLVLSRVSIPDLVGATVLFAAYLLIVDRREQRWTGIAAGCLSLAALLVKATLAPIVAALGLICLALRGSARQRLVVGFVAGLLAPVVLALLIAYAFFSNEIAANTELIAHKLNTIAQFIGLKSPYAMAVMVVDVPLASTFNTLNIFFWLGLLVLLSGHDLSERDRGHLIGATIWVAVFTLATIVSTHFPDRYRVLVFIPLAVQLAVAGSWLQRVGTSPMVSNILNLSLPSRVFMLGLVLAPSAIIFGPLTAFCLHLLGADTDRISVKLASIAISLVPFVLLSAWPSLRTRVLQFLMCWPLVYTAVWFMVTTLSSDWTFWVGDDFAAASRHIALLVICGLAALLLIQARIVSLPFGRVGVLAVVTVLCARIAPAYFDPQYQISRTSAELGELLSGAASVRAYRTEGLFLNNAIAYTPSYRMRPGQEFDFVVAGFYRRSVRPSMSGYGSITSYALAISDGCLPTVRECPPIFVPIQVYQR